jgi:hypothetical protein
MVDGGVSIAVRSVYPGKQARIILSYEVLQEAKKLPAKLCAEHKVSSAMNSNRIIDNRANDLNPSEFQGNWQHV